MIANSRSHGARVGMLWLCVPSRPREHELTPVDTRTRLIRAGRPRVLGQVAPQQPLGITACDLPMTVHVRRSRACDKLVVAHVACVLLELTTRHGERAAVMGIQAGHRLVGTHALMSPHLLSADTNQSAICVDAPVWADKCLVLAPHRLVRWHPRREGAQPAADVGARGQLTTLADCEGR